VIDETVNLPKSASIDIIKTGVWNDVNADGNADAGETVSYTFKVTNTGNVTLTNIVVTDPLFAVSGGPITLAPGQMDNTTFTGTYVLLQSDVDAGVRLNTATVNGKDPQDITITDSDDETVNLPKSASIDIVKTGVWNDVNADGNADAGETVSYTFKVTNTGNVTLSNILITDPLFAVSGGPITLAPGQMDNTTFTGTYTLLQSDVDAGVRLNTATVNGKDPQDITVTDSDDETVNLPKAANIDIVKTGVWNDVNADGNADAGETVSYTFKVTNTGNVTLTNIVVTDPLFTVTGGPISLAPGAMDNTTFTGTYALLQSDVDAGVRLNTATVNGKDPQDIIITDSDDETVNLPKSASIDIIKTGVWNDVNADGNADAGETVSYTFKVTNTGNVTLTNIVVTDPLFAVSGGPITLAPGQMDNTTFTGTYVLLQSDVDAGVRLNTATVNGKDPQDITITDSDDETVNLPKSASIDIVKTGVWNDVNADGNADAGETVSYTFKVTNTGNVTLSNILITDPLFAVSGGPITLAPGQMDNTTFTGTYTLLQSDVDAGVRLNTATVNGKDPQDITVTDSDDETVNLPKAANIDIVKTGVWNDVNADGNADAGETVSYTFKVTNTGNVTLTNIVVTDPLFTVTGGPISLAPGAMDNTTFTGTYALLQSDVDAGVRLNTATVNGKDPQDIIITDSDDETVNLPKSANIDIVKTGVWNDVNADGNADAGETVSYTFKVTNTGNVTLTNIVVTDPLFAVSGGPITLAPGQMDNTTFTGTYVLLQSDVDAGVRLNTATVNGKDPQDITITNSDDETVNLPQYPKIGLSKKLISAVNNLDGTFTANFELNILNIGNVTLGDIQLTDNLTSEFGNYVTPSPSIPGQYAISNFAIISNSINPLTLNSSFDGMTNQNIFNTGLGGTLVVGENMKVGLSILFRPNKYKYINQATVFGDKPFNDDPIGVPDDDPEDTRDDSDTGGNSTNDPNQGGINPEEPGDMGTVDDPTIIKIPASQLSGQAWNDLNGNGVQDPGEPGLIGIETWLYKCDGTLVRKDTTDNLGNYLFDFIPSPMDYYVVFKPGIYLPDYGFTTQNVGMDDQIDSDVNPGGKGPCVALNLFDMVDNYDAGLVNLSTYGDFVWHDKNGNGIQDIGENGVYGVKVTLFDASTNLPSRTTTTDNNGIYLFDKLFPKSYYAQYDPPSGWNITQSNVGNDVRDSDVDNSNGLRTNATTYISPGEIDRTWDLGLYNCAMISGRTFFDVNKNGVFDIQENGLNGLKVQLIDAMNGSVIETVTTSFNPSKPSDDGYYKFTCIKPGMYHVKFERPGHLAASEPFKGGNTDKDSDISHEFGVNTTRKFTVLSGDMILNVGAGFQDKATLGDRVWLDRNFNGIQDVNEEPVQGVKVAAYTPGGVMVSEATSGFDGTYMLDGVAQGDYYVKFTAPVSFGFTIPHTGSDNVDNDVDGTNGYGTTRMYRVQTGDAFPTIDAGLVYQVLPLEWLSFEANYNGEFTELDWATGVEINNGYFEVERRHESETEFKAIGQLDASTETLASRHDYEMDDLNVNQSGVYYYRIKQVDRDGKIQL
jgi:uncharacterized membrane protein